MSTQQPGLPTALAGATDDLKNETQAKVEGHKANQLRASLPALLGLMILGIAMVVFAWWGARIVRRRIRTPLPPTKPVGDEWLKKPLQSSPPPPHHLEQP